MSSHREAPEISKDPVADSTDLYAFVSPDHRDADGFGFGFGPKVTPLAQHVSCPPCNIGPLSTPDYVSLANAAVHGLPGGGVVFAGQRAEGFYVDLGAVFDLAILRPFEQL